MGVEYEDLRTILETLRGEERRERLLVLGDAIVHVQPAGLVALAAESGFALASSPGQLDPFTLGDALGFARTETLDVNGRASVELDLHRPLPPELEETYDCLVDAGVLFWCSDPGAALRSIFKLVKSGGTIIHISAVSGYYGRGYYNVHPLLFEDFYLLNGCEHVVSTYRTKFRPREKARLLGRRSRESNRVTVSGATGDVYLTEGSPTRIRFGDALPSAGESNVIPNNVVGVFVFRKRASVEPEMPLLMSPFDPGVRR